MEIFLAVLSGIILGVFSGIMPGIGTASILIVFYALLATLTPYALILCFLACIISSQYVASLTAIFTGVPGAESSFPTAKESSRLIEMGMTQVAVAQNALASLVGNVVGFLMLMVLLPLMGMVVQAFGAMVSLTICLIAAVAVVVTSEKKFQALTLILVAYMLSFIGPNPHNYEVYNFGMEFLNGGLSWISLTMGAIIGHSLSTLQETKMGQYGGNVMRFRPAVVTMRDKGKPLMRGSILGFFLGMVPGLSYILSSTICYQLEQKLLKKRTPKYRTMASLIASDAAHCSGTLAMLLPLLVFGVPITASEGVIYNIITLTSTTDMILASLYDNWLLTLGIIVIINTVSIICAWQLGGKIVSILLMPKRYLSILIIAMSVTAVLYAASLEGIILLPLLTFFITLGIFYFRKFDPLPFIFGVLTFSVMQSLMVSVMQLYF